MAECQLHRVGTAGLRTPVHQFQLQRTPATYSFVQRFCHSDSADGRAEHAHHQIDESLGQHIESTQNWRRYTGEKIRNLEQQLQQTQEEWRAYYR